MTNAHQLRKKLVALAGLFVIVIIVLAVYAQNQESRKLSTPQLIGKAYVEGEISEEEQLLYLAYAIFEYESLPARFRGNVGWRGTSTVEELHEAANSPSVLCSMSPDVRSEFQRLLNPKITCY